MNDITQILNDIIVASYDIKRAISENWDVLFVPPYASANFEDIMKQLHDILHNLSPIRDHIYSLTTEEVISDKIE